MSREIIQRPDSIAEVLDEREVLGRGEESRAPLMRHEETVVGVVWGEASWLARFAKVDGEFATMDIAISGTLARWKLSPPSADTAASFKKFMAEYHGLQKEWSDFKTSGGWTGVWATDANDAMLQAFEKRVYEIRLEYDRLAVIGVVPAPTPPVKPYEPPKGTVNESLTKVGDIVKWVVIGGVAYGAYRVYDSLKPEKKAAPEKSNSDLGNDVEKAVAVK